MQTVHLVTSLVNYRHSGQGFLSLTFRSAMTQDGVLSVLKRFLLGSGGKIPIGLTFEETKFKGYLQSAVPREKYLLMTVRVKPSKYLVLRFFEKVGKSAQVLMMDLPGYGEYLSRSDYYNLRKKVDALLREYCVETGFFRDDVIFRITSKTMFNKLSPSLLRRIEWSLKEYFEKGEVED